MKNDTYKLFRSYLKANNLKQTSERFKILEEVLNCDSFFYIKSIQKRLLNKKFNVSISSVHNTINLLIDLGIVTRRFENPKYKVCKKSIENVENDLFSVKVLDDYAKETKTSLRSKDDIGPFENWLINKLKSSNYA